MTSPRLLASRAAVNTVLVLSALYSVFPLFAMLALMNKDTAGLQGTTIFSWHGFHAWHNIVSVFTTDHGIYLRWYANTLLYAGVGAAVQALVCCATGYAFDKFEFRFKKPLFAVVLAGSLVPVTVLMLPQYLLFSKLHLLDTAFAILIPSVISPSGVFLARVFSRNGVPDEVVEAARVDGASEGRIFRRIALRLLAPGYATIGVFAFTSIWQGFQLALIMLSDNRTFPVNLGLFMWNSQKLETPDILPVAMTGSVLAIVPLILVMVSLQRFWKTGLTGGSLK